MRERIGEQFVQARRVAPETARRMTVSRLRLQDGLRAAAVEHEDVADYPVTGELSSMPDYEVPQAWAAAFDRAGFDGIHYRGRFSHFEGVSCWGIFGAAGPDDHAAVETLDLLDGFAACAEAGIAVLAAEPSDMFGLTIVDSHDL